MTKTIELRGPSGLRLVLDRAQIFPDDPGQGTPAMVYWRGDAATFWCARDTGEMLTANGGSRKLTRAQLEWLSEVEDVVAEFLAGGPNGQL